MTMERVEISQTQKNRCAGCGQTSDIVNVGSVEKGYRALCGQCFNSDVAKLDG
jgi:hypothetical protein